MAFKSNAVARAAAVAILVAVAMQGVTATIQCFNNGFIASTAITNVTCPGNTCKIQDTRAVAGSFSAGYGCGDFSGLNNCTSSSRQAGFVCYCNSNNCNPASRSAAASAVLVVVAAVAGVAVLGR